MAPSDRLIQSKWSAVIPLVAALLLMTTLWVIHSRFATDVRWLVDRAQGKLTLEAFAGRLDFMAAIEVQVTSIIVAVAVGVGLAISSIRNRERSEILVVCTILILGAVAFTILIQDDQSPLEYDDLLAKTAANQLLQVNGIRLALEGTTALAATILATATALLLFPAEGDPLKRLEAAAASYRGLSYLLAAGTILLVSDIFTKTVLTKWAATYYLSDPAKTAAASALGKSVVNGWGVYDSLFLAATYIPSALIVRTRLRNCGAAIDPKTAPSWFNPKWLSDTSLEDIGRAAATLAPFIVGQAANLIGKG